jgi:trigger factor
MVEVLIMKVSTEKMENSQLSLQIEAEADEMEKSLDEAYHRLVSRVAVPGFRKGKTPRTILEQHIGRGALLEEALERLIPKLYREAVESQEIKPIAEPQMEISQSEPLVFKAIVPLQPTVKLGDYHSIRIEPEVIEVGEDEIAMAMKGFQERLAILAPVERPVEKDDFITIDVKANIDDKPFLNHDDLAYEVNFEAVFPLPGFAQALVGMNKNEEKKFNIKVADDYSLKEFGGKECFFEVKVNEIKKKQLPELDDEFAKNSEFSDLNTMRQKITEELQRRAEQRSKLELQHKALDAVVEMSVLEYPPILEDREIEHFLNDEMQRFGIHKFEEYLEKLDKTEQEVVEELRPVARKRILNSLVLEELSTLEKIEVVAGEIDNRTEHFLKDVEDKQKMQEFLAAPRVRSSIEQSLLTEKTMERLVQIVSGTQEEAVQEEADKKESTEEESKDAEASTVNEGKEV